MLKVVPMIVIARRIIASAYLAIDLITNINENGGEQLVGITAFNLLTLPERTAVVGCIAVKLDRRANLNFRRLDVSGF